MSVTRRTLLTSTFAAAGAAIAGRQALAQPGHQHPPQQPPGGQQVPPAPPPPGRAAPKTARAATKLVVPNGSLLPWKQRDGVKIYHLVAQPVTYQIAPGLDVEAWGYNGSSPGPVIEATEGDRVRVYVTNKLGEPTSVHWHGILLPNGMDGVGGLTQKHIEPGKTFKYEFVFDRAGTFMYHPHVDEMTQMALGMMGVIVVHPRGERRAVRDYVLMLHEMKIQNGHRRPDPLAMSDFNVLMFNGKSFPATEPLLAEKGDLVRIRLANLGPMDHHPIHLHGHKFDVVATDGGSIPKSARHPDTTVLVPVGTTRTIEFIADNVGDWPLHCHMTHHVMNQMGHEVSNLIGTDMTGIDARMNRVVPGYMTMGQHGMAEMATMKMAQPKNSISMVGGAGPYGVIDMGGMFTILKVRDKLGAGDPGWYKDQAPKGTVASEAAADELARDGIKV